MPAGSDAIHDGRGDRLDRADTVLLRRQADQLASGRQWKILHPRTDGGEIGQFVRFSIESSIDPRHLVQHVEKTSRRQVEMGFETVSRNDHPVGAAVVTPHCEFFVASDGLSDERYGSFCEAA